MSRVVVQALLLAASLALLAALVDDIKLGFSRLLEARDRRVLLEFSREVDSSICSVLYGGCTVKVVDCPGVSVELRSSSGTILVFKMGSQSVAYYYPVPVDVPSYFPEGLLEVRAKRVEWGVSVQFEVVDGG